ncbi:MAG: FkbM family methyltransferase [Bacteroidales bacterium]|nr:FkbM family methyltransferase [Bacteroidales bacterium]
MGSILRFFKWQINTRLNPYPVIYPFTEKSKLIIQKGMTGATGNLYCGLHEYCDMSFLLHFLRKEDTFADIGANIGSYTILASAHVGAKTFSFEPVPSTFSHLMDNIVINRLKNNVVALNIALGSSKGTIAFTSSLDTTNHVANENEDDIISVPVETLDDVLENQQCPSLLKIDVEGFETEVFIGGGKTLKNKKLKAIIVELNGSGSRYGYDDKDIHNTLLGVGFLPYKYDPKTRILTEIPYFESTGNTIYLRDKQFVINRITNAQTFDINNIKI